MDSNIELSTIVKEDVKKIAKRLASIYVMQGLSESGVMAINPDRITKKVEQIWPEFLCYTQLVVEEVASALRNSPDGEAGIFKNIEEAYKLIPGNLYDF